MYKFVFTHSYYNTHNNALPPPFHFLSPAHLPLIYIQSVFDSRKEAVKRLYDNDVTLILLNTIVVKSAYYKEGHVENLEKYTYYC